MSDITRLSQIMIDECARLEPCAAEVCADEVNNTTIVYENTDFSVASSSAATVIGLRVISKNRLGFITTNSLDEKELKEKCKEAQMVARLSPESPFHSIAPRQKSSGLYTMEDEKLAKANARDLLRWTELLVDEARQDKRVSLDRAEVTLQTGTRLIQNSNGVLQKEKQTLVSWSIMGMAKDGKEVTSFDYDGDASRNYSDVEEKIKASAKVFRESVLGCLGSTTAKSYKGPVLFHPAAVASLLTGVIGFNVNARSQQDGMSKWANMLNQKVASNLFSIESNPLDETRPFTWSPFDREGVPTQRHDIIKDGILKFTAHNMFTASRAKTSPTGNATGGARSVPSIGISGLSVAPGTASDEELYKSLKQGLVLKRFSGNADPVSGQFSGVAKNSWWVENGKRTAALKEVMIAGNMFDLLQNIKMVGSRVIRQSGSFDSPHILIDGVSVTSG